MNPDYEKYPKIFKALKQASTTYPDLLLSSFSRILQRAELLWGSKEGALYFESLVLEDREDRNGFPPEVLSDVWLLKQIHESLYPGFIVSIHDPFNNLHATDKTGIQAFHATMEPGIDFVTTIETTPAEPAAAPAPNAAPVAPSQSQSASPADQKFIPWPSIRTQQQLYEADEVRRNGGQIYAAQGKKIGEILKSVGIIDDKILDGVEKRHQTKKAKDKPTGELLVYMGIIDQESLTRALCIQSGILMVDILSLDVPIEVLRLVPNENARGKNAMPAGVNKGTLFLAVADPFNFSDQQHFAFSTGLNIKLVFAPLKDIIQRIGTEWKEPDPEVWIG